MSKLLKYRDPQYFTGRGNEYFLFTTMHPLIKCSKLIYDKGFWFTFRGMQVKAETVECASLKEISGAKVIHKENRLVIGDLGEFGLNSYVYVFWNQVPLKDNNNKPLGFPSALEDTFLLNF